MEELDLNLLHYEGWMDRVWLGEQEKSAFQERKVAK